MGAMQLYLCFKNQMQNTGGCNKGDGCKYAHDMLGLELTRADFDFTTDALHDLNTEQVCRIMGLCIDFAKGCCGKGGECRYKHSAPIDVGMGNHKTTWLNVRMREGDDGYVRGDRGGLLDGPGPVVDGGMFGGGGGMMGGGSMIGMMGGGCGPMDNGVGGGFSREEFMMIKRDNEMLRMEVLELRKKNEGLKATNQFLLEENANMRMKEKMGGGGEVKAIQYNSNSPTGSYSNSGYSGGSSGYSGGGGGYSSGGYGGGSGYSSGRGGSGGW